MATKIRSRRYCQPSVHDYVCRKVQCGFRAREINEGVIRGEGVVARQDRIATRTTEARRNVRGVRETDGINPSNLEKSVGRIGWGVAVTAALRAPRGASVCEERDNFPSAAAAGSTLDQSGGEGSGNGAWMRGKSAKRDQERHRRLRRCRKSGGEKRGGTRCQEIDGDRVARRVVM